MNNFKVMKNQWNMRGDGELILTVIQNSIGEENKIVIYIIK